MRFPAASARPFITLTAAVRLRLCQSPCSHMCMRLSGRGSIAFLATVRPISRRRAVRVRRHAGGVALWRASDLRMEQLATAQRHCGHCGHGHERWHLRGFGAATGTPAVRGSATGDITRGHRVSPRHHMEPCVTNARRVWPGRKSRTRFVWPDPGIRSRFVRNAQLALGHICLLGIFECASLPADHEYAN